MSKKGGGKVNGGREMRTVANKPKSVRRRRKQDSKMPLHGRTAKFADKPRRKRSILRSAKPTRPQDIRDKIRLINNPDFHPPQQFSFLRGQEVVRKSDRRRRPLRVLAYQGDKIFLNDLTFATEAELQPLEFPPGGFPFCG